MLAAVIATATATLHLFLHQHEQQQKQQESVMFNIRTHREPVWRMNNLTDI